MNPIADLGFVAPGTRRWFTLRVTAPKPLPQGSEPRRFPVLGYLSRDSLVRDSAVLVLRPLTELEVHNVPNPFESRTTFFIELPENGDVSLTVFDRTGACIRKVLKEATEPAGETRHDWDATNEHSQRVAPGTYQYLLEYTHGKHTDRILKKLVVGKD